MSNDHDVPDYMGMGLTETERRHDRIVLAAIICGICVLTGMMVVAAGWAAGIAVLVGVLALWAAAEFLFRVIR